MPRSFRIRVVLGLAALGGACTPSPQGPQAPTAPPAALSVAAASAMAAEAEDATSATPYLDVIDRALGAPDDPWALATVVTALDALVERRVPDLDPAIEHAVVHRSRAALVEVAARLQRSWERASDTGPLLRPLLADALHALALRVGDASAAARWRARSGCVPAASVAGPVAWPPLRGLDQPSPVPAHDALPATYRGVPPFASDAPAQAVSADGCGIDLNVPSALRGVRAVVVDLDNPSEQVLTVAFSSSSAAVVELGGERLLERPYALGGEPATLLGRARVGAGRVRLVARVAQNLDSQSVRIVVVAPDGTPIASVAPAPGERAPATVSHVEPVALWPGAGPSNDAELGLAAATLLALGQSRPAAALLDRPRASSPDSSTGARSAATGADGERRVLGLLRLRMWQAARDLPRPKALTRIQSAAEQVLASCPRCWEARLAQAAALEERRGAGVGTFAALDALGVRPGVGGAPQPSDRSERVAGAGNGGAGASAPELGFVAVRARRAGLFDIARQSYDELERVAPGSALLADVDAVIHHRLGDELVRAACAGGTSRAGLRCLQAEIGRGDLDGTLAELGRLRRLRGNPELGRDTELGQWLLRGRLDRALAIYRAMSPTLRTLAVLGALISADGGVVDPAAAARAAEPGADARQAGARDRLAALRSEFRRDRLRARDVPSAYEPLARLLGVVDDPTEALEREGRELVMRDRANAFLPGAAIAVLRHIEHFELEPSGLLYYRVYDLRRVSGTTDVSQGAWSGGPTIDGRSVARTLRQRIHKRDGRVLDPDPQATGAQTHTELTQLESGDYVEASSEGWALPEDSGQLVVDTPDLLPQRASVREAEIALARPRGLALALWTHALLGAGETRASGDRLTTTWRVHDLPPRRLEEGVPPLEARVGLSFGTDSWQRIAATLDERLRSLDEHDPYVARFAREAVGPNPPSADKQIALVVAAVGHQVKQADAEALSDFVASLGGGAQRETARTILEQGHGSRSWVIHRALRELGIASHIAVSETEAFSASPGFPPHVGRFRHPLVMAELGTGPLWIDADVSGPPLPPGRVSPELRGRQALLPSGELRTVDAQGGFEPDEIDVRLTVDPSGDASGTFTALVRGSAAQQIAEQLEVVVGSERTKLLREVVLGWVPWADVRTVTLSSEPGSWQVALRADIAVPGFGQPEGRDAKVLSLPGLDPVHMVVPRPQATTLGARLNAQAGRTSDLSIDSPLFYHLHRRIELPAGAVVLRAPKPLALDDGTLGAVRKLSVTGGVIEEDFRLNLPAGTIPLARVAEFEAKVQSVDDGFLGSTQVRLKR